MSKQQKEINYSEFESRVGHYWSVPPHCYGSIQYAARAAKEEFQEKGFTNVEEIHEQYYQNHKKSWHYAGD